MNPVPIPVYNRIMVVDGMVVFQCSECGCTLHEGTHSHTGWHERIHYQMEELETRLDALESAPVRRVLVKAADIHEVREGA